MELKKRRWPAAIGGMVLGLSLAGGSAFAAGVGSGPFDYLDLRSPDGTIQRVTVGNDGKLTVSSQATTPPVTTPPTTTPPTTTPPTTTNPVTVQENASAFTFSSGWTNCGCNGATYRYANTAGSTYTLKFSGTSVALFGMKEKPGGTATVAIDGKAAGTINHYAATTSGPVEVFRADGLSDGNHTVVVTVDGKGGNSAATGTAVTIDRAVVNGVPATTNPPTTTEPPVTTPPTTTPPTSQPPTTTPPVVGAGWPASAFPTSGPNLGWLSGSSGEFTANGQQGNWRGTADSIGTTWVTDSNPDATLNSEFANWTGSLIVSLPLVSSPGEWANCATGACDARWTTELKKVQASWDKNSNRKGILFYSPAWEFNGSWFNHHVDPNNPAAMANSLKRFRAIQKAVSPNAKVVLTANRDTSGLSVDWRRAIPGYTDGNPAVEVPKYLDAMGVDYYNGWAVASRSVAEFEANSKKVDGYGAPLGIEAHRLNAAKVGLPLAVPEWSGIQSGNGSTGDEPTFPVAMHDFFKRNAGTGAGNVVADVNFAVKQEENGKFYYGPNSLMPKASAAYASVF